MIKERITGTETAWNRMRALTLEAESEPSLRTEAFPVAAFVQLRDTLQCAISPLHNLLTAVDVTQQHEAALGTGNSNGLHRCRRQE